MLLQTVLHVSTRHIYHLQTALLSAQGVVPSFLHCPCFRLQTQGWLLQGACDCLTGMSQRLFLHTMLLALRQQTGSSCACVSCVFVCMYLLARWLQCRADMTVAAGDPWVSNTCISMCQSVTTPAAALARHMLLKCWVAHRTGSLSCAALWSYRCA